MPPGGARPAAAMSPAPPPVSPPVSQAEAEKRRPEEPAGDGKAQADGPAPAGESQGEQQP